jgi:tRNA 2-selenouridine synthase
MVDASFVLDGIMKSNFPDHVSIEEWEGRSADFDVIIDARSEREFADDHLPGALNLPVVKNDQYAVVGTLHKTDTHEAYLLGVRLSLANISAAIDQSIKNIPRDSRVLVYCFRGGKRSILWLNALSMIGFDVTRLTGGWKAYRTWVRARLETLSPQFRFNVFCGPTGSGKTRLLYALGRAGAQVIDLEDLARHRGSLIGHLPGVAQPSQKLFDSRLLQIMRSLDPSRPVWLEAESKKIGAVALPKAFFETMHSGKLFRIDAPMARRVELWREDYAHFEDDPEDMLKRLSFLRPLVGGVELEYWRQLASEKKMPELFERLMTHHYDPAYTRSIRKNYTSPDAKALFLNDLTPTALDEVALELIREGKA